MIAAMSGAKNTEPSTSQWALAVKLKPPSGEAAPAAAAAGKGGNTEDAAALLGGLANGARPGSRLSWDTNSVSARTCARYADPRSVSAEPLSLASALVAKGVAERKNHAAANGSATGGAAPIAAIPSSTATYRTELRALTQSLERRTAAATKDPNKEGPSSSHNNVVAQEL